MTVPPMTDERFHEIGSYLEDTSELPLIQELFTEVERLRGRVSDLLLAIGRLSRDLPYPKEVAGMNALITANGTLRARVRELEEELRAQERYYGVGE